MGFMDKAKAKLEEAAEKAKPMAEKVQHRASETFDSVKKSAENFREGLQKDDPADAPVPPTETPATPPPAASTEVPPPPPA